MKTHWIKELKSDSASLYNYVAARGLADYIIATMSVEEQTQLAEYLVDATKETRVIIEVRDRANE